MSAPAVEPRAACLAADCGERTHSYGHPHVDTPVGWGGSLGPFPHEYGRPHVYARNVHSGAGNCVCGAHLGDRRHVQAAPGVDVPERER